MAVKEMNAEASGKSKAGQTGHKKDPAYSMAEGSVRVEQELEFEPVLDYIVVADIEGDEVIIAPGQREGHVWGKVRAVGPGRPSEYSGELIRYPGYPTDSAESIPCQLQDHVLYSRGAGTLIPIDGVEHRFLLPRDILARRWPTVDWYVTDPAAIAKSDAEFQAAQHVKDELRGS